VDFSSHKRLVLELAGQHPGVIKVVLRWLLLLIVALVVAVTSAAWLLHAPPDDLLALSIYLLVSGATSALIGLGALLLLRYAPGTTLRLKLVLPSLVAAVVICVNVFLTARLMFIASEDVGLLLLLLAFAFSLSVGMASAVAGTLLLIIRALDQGAREIADGNYRVRLPAQTSGRDELEHLASSFNWMAQQVQESFDRQREIEQSKRQFLVAISHDLRTPLTAILAMVEAVDDGVVSDPETIAHYIHTMRSETRHLSALIDDLFELSRLEAGPLELHRDLSVLDDLISDTLEAQHALAEQKGVRLIGHLEDGLPALRMDVQRIQRVLNNLMQNSLEHTPTGGSVLIRASRQGVRKAGVLVEVLDTGQGIPESDLPHIFDRFYRGEPSRSRTSGKQHGAHAGLGLTVARALVEAHGGQIRASSPCACWPEQFERPDTGPGSIFAFTLPLG
jgi:signal transduction histidine kinase